MSNNELRGIMVFGIVVCTLFGMFFFADLYREKIRAEKNRPILVYVDTSRDPGGDGKSWVTAYGSVAEWEDDSVTTGDLLPHMTDWATTSGLLPFMPGATLDDLLPDIQGWAESGTTIPIEGYLGTWATGGGRR